MRNLSVTANHGVLDFLADKVLLPTAEADLSVHAYVLYKIQYFFIGDSSNALLTRA